MWLLVLFTSFVSLCQSIANDDEVSLLFAGDAMQHMGQIENAKCATGYEYDECFKYIKPQIEAADYAIVNLEAPLGGQPYSGYPCFSAPDQFATALKSIGFDLFLTANNHCLDKHDAGLVRTINKLDESGIPHIGTYISATSRAEQHPYIADVKGIKIAFLNYTYGTNGISIRTNAVVNYINKTAISNDIKTARQRGAEFIVVCIHWGVEYVLVNNTFQKELADYIQHEGADLIIGSHPHVIQPIELRNNADKRTLVVYSLGNFISNMKTADTQGGCIVSVNIKRINNKIEITDANYTLFYNQRPANTLNHNDPYLLIPTYYCDSVRYDCKSRYKAFINNARKIYNKHNKGIKEKLIQ